MLVAETSVGHSWFVLTQSLVAAADVRAIGSATRRRVLAIIEAHPGITMTAIADAAQVHWGAAHFHVTRLAALGLVRTLRVGRRRLVFACDALEGEWPEERSVLMEPTCRKVALAVLDRPGLDVLGLVEATGLSERVVYHHAARLLEMGLIVTGTPGRYRGLRSSAKLCALLVEP